MTLIFHLGPLWLIHRSAGKYACPPDDCGGPWGYEHLLEVLRDPKHEEHDEMREWIGGGFDPRAFDLNEINRTLKSVR